MLLLPIICGYILRLSEIRLVADGSQENAEFAKVNAGSSMTKTPLGEVFHSLSDQITKPAVKALIIVIALALVGTAPIGIAKVTPDYVSTRAILQLLVIDLCSLTDCL